MKNRQFMTKVQAEQEFKQTYLHYMKYTHNNDKPAIREAWNNYTDRLCKDGLISVKQYETWDQPKFCK